MLLQILLVCKQRNMGFQKHNLGRWDQFWRAKIVRPQLASPLSIGGHPKAALRSLRHSVHA
jgi:hypothetical protein